MPSTSISTPAVNKRNHRMHVLWNARRGVQRDRGPHRVDILLRYPVAAQEVARGVRAVHLETLIGAAVLRRQPHVVKHRARIEQFGIERQAAPRPGQRAPVDRRGWNGETAAAIPCPARAP